MKQTYLEEIRRTEAATPTYYTYDNLVKAGEILVVTNMSVHWSAMATTETGQFFIEDGGQKIFLGDDTPGKAGGRAHWSGKAFIGEHKRAGVYTPDSANLDVIEFCIVGELWSIDCWRKYI